MDKIKMCRACLAEDEPVLSLFDAYEHDLTLADILQSCLLIEIFEGDNFPSYLCDKCIHVLTQFYNFTIIYEQSNKHLNSLIKKGSKTEICNDLEEQNSIKAHKESKGMADFKFIQNIKADPHYNDADNENQGDLMSNFEDFDYADIKSAPGAVQENMGYITLDAIKSENLDLEICSYSGQTMNTQNFSNNEPSTTTSKLVVLGNETFEEIVKYECSLCGEEHLYLTAFRNHMRLKHTVYHVNPAEYSKTVQIKVPQSEPLIDELTQAHEEILLGDPTLSCNVCSKKFHFPAQINKHMKIHLLEKKFICEVCGASFIRKTYLDDHKEGHSTERKHSCPFCDKKFRRRTVLRAHKRSHTHRNHYVCELCGRAFTGKGTLRTHHLLIHVRERNFACMICHQKFPLKSTLSKHVMRHEKREKGEKGFNCTMCDMEYRDKSSLKRHVEVKHLGNIVLVPCPDCPKEYTSNANLQKHRKRHHPNKMVEEIL